MITLDEVRQRVAALANLNDSAWVGLLADWLRSDVLKAIAAGAPDAQELAAAALEAEVIAARSGSPQRRRA